jgi:hypothetical protein
MKVRDRITRLVASPVARVFIYYAALGGAVLLLARFLPGFQRTLFSTPAIAPGGVGVPGLSFEGLAAGDAAGSTLSWSVAVATVVSMLGALIIMLPVGWVYIITRQRRGYDQAVVHTLLILPIAVASIAVIVKDSAALAFSLVGIVAAVRFRSTLKDTRDAVYVFVAIAVGLACGVRALPAAAVSSLVFNVVILVLWKFEVGNIYADQGEFTPALSLGGALTGPERAGQAFTHVDPRLLNALGTEELEALAAQVARLQQHIRDRSAKKGGGSFNAVVLVHAPLGDAAQRAVETVLQRYVSRWKLAEITPGRDTNMAFEYLVRMKKDATPGALLDALRTHGLPDIAAAEFRSLKGLKEKVKAEDDE